MSIFSRRRKPAPASLAPQPAPPEPRYITLAFSVEVKDAEGKQDKRWWLRSVANLPRSMAPVAAVVTTPARRTTILQGDRFYKPAVPERMESNRKWVVRHLGAFESELQAEDAAVHAFSQYIVVDGSLWVKIHDPSITVGPEGLIVDLVPRSEEPPLRVPLRIYDLAELSKARAVVKALPESSAICTEVTLTDAIDWERVARRRRADALERVKAASRTDSPGTPAVQALAELMAKLPPHAMREAAQLLIKAADAAER